MCKNEEIIEIPIEIAGNKALTEKFRNLSDKCKLLYMKLWDLYRTTDLNDNRGIKYVCFKTSDIEREYGIKQSSLYYYCVQMKKAELIEYKSGKKGTPLRIYLRNPFSDLNEKDNRTE